MAEKFEMPEGDADQVTLIWKEKRSALSEFDAKTRIHTENVSTLRDCMALAMIFSVAIGSTVEGACKKEGHVVGYLNVNHAAQKISYTPESLFFAGR